MLSQKKKFYITTAIDYVNAPPHCGHALEKVQTDVLARYHRLLGKEVLFLTGTDENSLKNVKAAEEEGILVKQLVDRNSKKFYELKKVLNLSFDDFVRTTEERHIKGAQKLWLACKKDIYKKSYRGLYCVGCEEFYKEQELVNGLCPEHKTKPEIVEEENYFFKLSKYQDRLRDIIEKDELKVIPETRKNEVLSFINQGLEDICISRSAERAKGWGIDVPGDKTQKIWVWFDALSNYINAIGYATDEKRFKKWWPADIHVIGKGISRFHCIYWPAMLLCTKLPLPKSIFVHGYLTFGGEKMSKSSGECIDPCDLVQKYGTDSLRYFLLREIPSAEDGDFTLDKFKKRYNSDLANDLGNLVYRTLTMAENYWKGLIPKVIPNDMETLSLGQLRAVGTVGNFQESIDEEFNKSFSFLTEEKDFSFHNSLFHIITAVFICDGYIENHKHRLYKPSEKLENKKEKRDRVLYNVLEGIRHIAWMLLPFLPETADKIFTQLGINPAEEKQKNLEEAKRWDVLEPGTRIKKLKPLFPRI